MRKNISLIKTRKKQYFKNIVFISNKQFLQFKCFNIIERINVDFYIMEIRANIKVSDILNRRNNTYTSEQKAVAVYFDKNNNGVIDSDEAINFNRSKIVKEKDKIKIALPNGKVVEYEDLTRAKSDKYYKSGHIPVAVIDIFSGPEDSFGCAGHGNSVANLIKKHNPDISLTKFDASPMRTYTDEQKNFIAKCEENPNYEEELVKTPEGRSYLEKLFSPDTTIKPYAVALDEVQQQIGNGVKFDAVNLSSGCSITYEDLNKICEQELGTAITPENVAKYRMQIKNILSKKINSGEVTKLNIQRAGGEMDAKLILSIMDKIENLKIPVYVASGYKVKDEKTGMATDIQTVNLFAIPKNARAVQGGTTFNGKIQSPLCNTNSLGINPETGKRYIEDDLDYSAGEFSRNTASFATPIALAKELDIVM